MLRRFLPLLFLALGAAGLAALAITRPRPEPLQAQEKVWTVAVEEARPQRLAPTLTLYARVDSPRVATLSAAVNADVREVLAMEGQAAAAGELLARLDDREARLAVAEREAEIAEIRASLANELRKHDNDTRALTHELRLLELARRDVERAQKLATRDLGSAAGLDEARQAEARQALAVDNRRTAIAGHASIRAGLEARISRARALLERARLDISRTEVRAPFGGRIADVTVAVGDRVRPGDRLLSMFDTDGIELRAQVPIRYLGRVRESLEAGRRIRARARVDGRLVEGVLDRLGAAVARGRGGADALFRVVGPERAGLELGRTVELLVSLPAVADVIPVPTEALYGTDRLYKLDGARMRPVRVERIGEHRDERGRRWLLVRSADLIAGDRIVVTQLPNAVDGLKVRIAEPAPDER